jgi:hypothetical protein
MYGSIAEATEKIKKCMWRRLQRKIKKVYGEEATEKNKKSVWGGGYRKNKKVYGEEDTEKNKKKLIGVASVKYTNGERSEHIMQVCYKDIVYFE